MESEQFVPQEAHDLGSPQKVRVELQQQIEDLEKELEDPTLSVEDVKSKKEELEFFRKQYAETDPNKQ